MQGTRILAAASAVGLVVAVLTLATSLTDGGREGLHVPDARPPQVVGYDVLPRAQRLDLLARLARDHHLVAVQLGILRTVLDRHGDLVERNHAANALAAQEPQPPWLADRLATMAADPDEDRGWRDFAVQHLADAVGASSSVDSAAVDLLRRLAAGSGAIAGTALIHLQRLGDRRVIALDAVWMTARLREAIRRQHDDPALAVTAIALAASRRASELLPEIRVAARSPNPAIRRAAVAAIGTVGEVDDRTSLAPALTDDDRSVARMAAASLDRLDARTHRH